MTFRSSFGRLCLAASAAILIVAPVALSAQSDDRRRAVGNWLVEDVGDGDGGRAVRMTREDGDYSIDYHVSFAPGAADHPSQGFMVWRLTCGQGGGESLDGASAGQARVIRGRLVDYLERCDAPANERESLLRDFDRAFALLAEWAGEARTAVAAGDSLEAAADAMDAADNAFAAAANDMAMDYAADMNMSTDMNAATDMDMDMDMDMNMANMSFGEEVWTNSSGTDEPK
jgi:hypothetical protein